MPAVAFGDAAERQQAFIRAVVAGQCDELDVVGDGRSQQGFQHIAEVTGATERPDDDELGVPRRALDVGVDRHGVRQRGEASEAQPRLGVARTVGGGDCGELGVGGGEEEHVAGRLAKVDRLLAVGNRSFLG